MKFIHITDLHLIAPGSPLWGIDAHANMTGCLADIARWHADAEFCIISGDLTDKAEPEAYDWLRRELEILPMPVHLMVGNHDHRQTFRASFPGAMCDAQGFVQGAFDTSAGRFILLDTVKSGSSAGELCEHRMNWLTGELSRAHDKPAWLFMHHPPCDVSIPYMDRIKLDEHEAFAELIANHSNIRHIFFGHVHRAVFVNWNGIACTALPSLCHQIPLNMEATEGKPYSTGPALYGVVLVNDGQTTVHFEHFNERGPAAM